jgi:hypothetical protein
LNNISNCSLTAVPFWAKKLYSSLISGGELAKTTDTLPDVFGINLEHGRALLSFIYVDIIAVFKEWQCILHAVCALAQLLVPG